MLTTSADSALEPTRVKSRSPVPRLNRVRYQLALGLLFAVVLPTVGYHSPSLSQAFILRSSLNTEIGSACAFCIALYLYRRVASFPGIGKLGYVIPAVTAGYSVILAIFFAARFDYSRLNYGISFTLALVFFFLISFYLRRAALQRFYIIPSEHAQSLTSLPGAEWMVLSEPRLPPDDQAILVVDLRADMDDSWERLIADAALNGFPVYHSKQVQESLTGRVEIEHLSENSFGSLIPNRSYTKIKQIADITISILLIPLFIIPALLFAVMIKIDSPGPVFYRQLRQGYRGKPFYVLKFRTMQHAPDQLGSAGRDVAITQDRDPRITRIGRFLRRTRIDEIPQIWNVLRGEMSWIGPRPEAISLSEWYMSELPFYTYRHIVRPGITGWAQVNQGHVADLDGVHAKLHFDFFYIKHFSSWLDILIIWRTIWIVVSGYGSK